MKVLIIADSHGHLANLKHVMGFAERIKAKAVIHCGDWDNTAALETVLAYQIPLYSVLGNADIDPKIAEIFKRTYFEFKLNGRRIGVIHDIKNLESGILNLDILFCGHTHKQFKKDNIVNPGALVDGLNFAVYDTETGNVELIHE